MISGHQDELSEIQAENSFEWKIANFLSLSSDVGKYYQSPTLSFAKSSWNLQVYPRGNNVQNETVNWISVYLRGQDLTDVPFSISCSLGIMKADGYVQKVVDKKMNFDSEKPVVGEPRFCQRDELVRRKAELLPNDDFTITCTMKHTSVKILGVTSPNMSLIELERLATDFKDLYAYKRDCDVIIKVKDKIFDVHRSVLIARSSKFRSKFEQEVGSNNSTVISIDHSDPESFEDFLKYLYTGKVESISPHKALSLYRTAEEYDVKELKSFCVEYMMRNLTAENVSEVASLAERYKEHELFSVVEIFFSEHYSKIIITVEWMSLLQKDCVLANMLLIAKANRENR